ncbi:MAG: hypothetical protein AAF581_04320 [Planctomycetota bacterium]
MADTIPPVVGAIPANATGQEHSAEAQSPQKLQPGHSYPALVVRVLAQQPATADLTATGAAANHRYEVSIFDQHFSVASPRQFPVGAVLRVVPVVTDTGTALEVRGLFNGAADGALPAPATTTTTASGAQATAEPEAPAAANRATHVVETLVARTAQRLGVRLPADVVRNVAAQITREQLPAVATATAAARLTTAELPLLPALLRGGALAESAPQVSDLAKPLAQLGQEVQRAVPAGELRDDILVRLRAAAAQPASPPIVVDGADPVVIRRASPLAIQETIVQLVENVVRSDRTLTIVGRLLDHVDLGPDASARTTLAQRVDLLLQEGRAATLSTLDLLDGLGVEAKGKAVTLLRELEQARLREPSLFREVLLQARDLYQRAEGAVYLQLLEWAALDQPERSELAGALYAAGEGHGLRVTVRDQRRGTGPDGAIGFVIEIDSPKLGHVQVSGRLLRRDGEASPLDVHVSAEEVATAQRIDDRLGLLIEALREQGYDPAATVSHAVAASSEAAETPAPESDHALDVKV